MYHKLVTSLGGALIALAFAATATLAATEGGQVLESALAPAFGAVVTGTTPVTPTATATAVPPGTAKIAAALAASFGLKVDDVLAIRDQKQGWGEVFKILFLAKATGQTPEEILALRQEQQGWGQIFKALSVKPGKKDNLGQTLKANHPTPSTTPTAVNTAVPSATPSAVAPTNKKPAATPTPRPTPMPDPANRGQGNGQGHGNNGRGPGNGNTPGGPDNNPGNGKGK
ncbi:MAG: hypothetical protein HZB53_03655 [Chloroflexi bacterium]|nr:hypothetical protein [Chloroflexota bacterium]